MKTLCVILLLTFAAMGAYFTVFMVDEGEYGVITSTDDDEVVAVLPPGMHFVPRAVFPWKTALTYGRAKASNMFDLSVPLPGLEELDSRHYSVGIRVNAAWEVDFQTVTGDLLAEKGRVVHTIGKFLKGGFTGEMAPYLHPMYNSRKLELEMEAVSDRVFEAVKKKCAGIGIRVLTMGLVGPVSVPNPEIFREGVSLAAELRQIENTNRKDLLILENKLRKEDFKNKKYLENLREIAKLVKNNPDVLKYLYIKGFSKNVRAILMPERTGLPFGLDFGEKGPRKEGDVDNFR